MNKTMCLLGLSIVMIAVLAVFASATPTEAPAAFCSDPDGKDIWTAGITTDEKGSNADDCDGASHNLKEFYCDGDRIVHDNIQCSDFDAICVTVGDKSVGDYCEACPDGYKVIHNECVESCVGCQCDNSCPPIDPCANGGCNGVPEFSTMALGAAIIGVGLGLALLRKK